VRVADEEEEKRQHQKIHAVMILLDYIKVYLNKFRTTILLLILEDLLQKDSENVQYPLHLEEFLFDMSHSISLFEE
jgi:hypothetical protein